MAERGKAGSGRKFSITIQVPEEVGAGWPDRATAERLVQEVYQAMGGQAPPARPTRGVRAGLLLVVFALGAAAGYLGAAALPALRSRSSLSPAAGQAPAPAAEQPEQPAPAADASAPPAVASAPAPAPVPAPSQPSPAPAAAPAAVYWVQVGAFRERANATAQLARLLRDGFRAEIRRSGLLYVVLVGPPQPRGDADRLAARLREHGYDVLVTRAP